MTRIGPSQGASARANARAKLNLYLHMVGRRDDGFHLLESLVAFTALGDTIAAHPAEALSLTLEGPFGGALQDTPADDNLVLRAARALKDWAASQGHAVTGAALTLEKVLPVASGIGGGSADAAAALLALKALWNLPIESAALATLAETLGADVPACVAGRTALMEGIGERLTPLDGLPGLPVLLVNPGVALPTPSVYRAFRAQGGLKPTPRPKPAGPWADAGALIRDLAATENDLEPAAIGLCPEVGAVLADLQDTAPLLARMSGSGATCFALYGDRAAAAAAARQLGAKHPAWWVRASVLEGGR